MLHGARDRQEFALGTWLDPEEMAYPSGSITAGRKAKALCTDGHVRTFQCGIPDTYFSIPARTKAYGKTVTGFLHTSDTYDDGKYQQVLKFTADKKYRSLFEQMREINKR